MSGAGHFRLGKRRGEVVPACLETCPGLLSTWASPSQCMPAGKKQRKVRGVWEG